MNDEKEQAGSRENASSHAVKEAVAAHQARMAQTKVGRLWYLSSLCLRPGRL
jgi:hypothetical protein